MAGVDTSIYSQLRQPQVEMPMAQMGNALQIKNLMGAGQLQNLQLQQAQQGMEEQKKLRALFGSGTTPTAEQVYAVSPTQGAAYAKTQQEAQVRQQQMLKHDDDLIKSFAAQSREELPTLTPANWGQWRAAQMQRASMLSTPQYRNLAQQSLQKIPEQFDPNFINATLAAGQAAPAGHTRVAGGGLSPADPEFLKGKTAVAAAGAPRIDVHTGKKFGEAFATQVAQQDVALLDAARKAPDLATRANQVLEMVGSGKVITGAGADIRLQLGKALNLAGASDAEIIANTEVLSTDLARNTLDAIKASGLGAGSGFSNADRDFLEKAVGGKITLEGSSIERLAKLAHRAAEKTAQRWGDRSKRIPKEAMESTGLVGELPTVSPLYQRPRTQPQGAAQQQYTPAEIDAELRRRGVAR